VLSTRSYRSNSKDSHFSTDAITYSHHLVGQYVFYVVLCSKKCRLTEAWQYLIRSGWKALPYGSGYVCVAAM